MEVDSGRFERAVLILVDNAARHSPPDRWMVLAARTESGQLTIEVAAGGSGVPPEELPFNFDRFKQVRNRRNRKKEGSGLGFPSRTIVTAHGGTIDAANEPGAGTRMTIRLPLATAADALIGIETPSGHGKTNAGSTPRSMGGNPERG